MSSAAPKLVFLLFFLVNCLLWSNSRYADLPEYASRSSLVKRSSGERPSLTRLLLSNDTRYTNSEDQCRPIVFPVEDQCENVSEYCPSPHTVLSIPYVRNYFCARPSLRPAIFAGYVVWLLFLFSTLGISASDFFCPNLGTLSRILGLDENVAGVTFLAFGNGSPDVFATFSAMRTNSGGLAIGELLGAAAFVTSCVVGSMCIIKPFKVDRAPFLRDVGFFTVAVTLVLFVLWDSELEAWESIGLVVLYFFYVGVVVVGSWWERRRDRLKKLETLMRDEFREEGVPDVPYINEPYQDEPSPAPAIVPYTRGRAISTPGPPRQTLHLELPPRPHSRPHTRSTSPQSSHLFPTASTPSPHTSHMPSFSLIGALEFRRVVSSLQHDAAATSLNIFETPISPYPGGHYHRHHSQHHVVHRAHSAGGSRSRTPAVSINEAQDPWDAALARSEQGLLLAPRTSPRASLSEEQRDAYLHVPVFPALDSEIGNGNGNGNGNGAAPVQIPGSTPLASSPPHPHPYPHPHPHTGDTSVSIPTIELAPATPSEADMSMSMSIAESSLMPYNPPSRRQRFFHKVSVVWHVLFPTLHGFRNKSLLGMVAALFAAPAVMALTLTLPVVVSEHGSDGLHGGEKKKLDGFSIEEFEVGRDGPRLVEFEEESVGRERLTLVADEDGDGEDEDEDDDDEGSAVHELKFNRWLMAAQCVLGPLFCVAILFSNTPQEPWILLATGIAGTAMGILVAVFAHQGDHPAARLARCTMGFIVAIVWIMAIADEVVEVLQTFGLIFGLSDAIIGLTIFAVGNSLADLVANMSVAVFAPIMGFSACFGGPMLNILLGIGISGTYIIRQTNEPYPLEFSTTLVISSTGLLVLLVATLVWVPWNGYVLTRKWGVALIVAYSVLMGANIVVEATMEAQS